LQQVLKEEVTVWLRHFCLYQEAWC